MAWNAVTDVNDGQSFGGAAWQSNIDAVEQIQTAISALTQFVSVQPGGTTDAPTTGALSNWVTLSSTILVPASSTSATVQCDISGVFCITGDADMDFRLTLGGSAPTVGGANRFDYLVAETTKRGGFVLSGRWNGLTPEATISLILQANRASGTGTIRADTTSRFNAHVTFAMA